MPQLLSNILNVSTQSLLDVPARFDSPSVPVSFGKSNTANFYQFRNIDVNNRTRSRTSVTNVVFNIYLKYVECSIYVKHQITQTVTSMKSLPTSAGDCIRYVQLRGHSKETFWLKWISTRFSRCALHTLLPSHPQSCSPSRLLLGSNPRL